MEAKEVFFWHLRRSVDRHFAGRIPCIQQTSSQPAQQVATPPFDRVGATERRLCFWRRLERSPTDYRLAMDVTDPLSVRSSCCTAALLIAHAAAASDLEALRALDASSSACDACAELCAFAFDPSTLDAGALADPAGNVAAAHLEVRQDTASAPGTAAPSSRRFGAAGSWRWQVLGGGGTGTDGISNAQLGAGISWFVVDDLSIDVQANADWFDQSGANAWGGDVELLFRWHFIARDTWSLYVDGGCGLMWTSRDVPPDSASFNFTPQAGAGITWEIASDTRLMLGARWFHASNANTGSPNPSYNGVFAYAGVSFGF
jgi:hypothetical protein